jgi:hypothetical protein
VCGPGEECVGGRVCCGAGTQLCGGTCCSQMCLQNQCVAAGSTQCGGIICEPRGRGGGWGVGRFTGPRRRPPLHHRPTHPPPSPRRARWLFFSGPPGTNCMQGVCCPIGSIGCGGRCVRFGGALDGAPGLTWQRVRGFRSGRVLRAHRCTRAYVRSLPPLQVLQWGCGLPSSPPSGLAGGWPGLERFGGSCSGFRQGTLAPLVHLNSHACTHPRTRTRCNSRTRALHPPDNTCERNQCIGPGSQMCSCERRRRGTKTAQGVA